jgi:hypothetical protein
MRTRSYFIATLRTAVVLAAATIGATAAKAQSRAAPPASGLAFDVTPYVGYMIFGSYIDGPFGTSLTNAPAPVIGAQLGMHLTPSISVIGNLATSSSDIQAGIPFLGGLSIADSRMVFYDAGLQLDIPVTTIGGTSFSPFIQAGAGGIRYDISQSIFSTSANNFAANVGLGADVAINRSFGVRLMAKDYIGKFDFKDATTFDFNGNTANSFAFSAGVRVSF